MKFHLFMQSLNYSGKISFSKISPAHVCRLFSRPIYSKAFFCLSLLCATLYLFITLDKKCILLVACELSDIKRLFVFQ